LARRLLLQAMAAKRASLLQWYDAYRRSLRAQLEQLVKQGLYSAQHG
jgi:hypothetical protein